MAGFSEQRSASRERVIKETFDGGLVCESFFVIAERDARWDKSE
jgi:hypothetical protein